MVIIDVGKVDFYDRIKEIFFIGLMGFAKFIVLTWLKDFHDFYYV